MPPRICVVGSSNMDLIVRSSRLPQPGETLEAGSFATWRSSCWRRRVVNDVTAFWPAGS